MLKHFFSFFLYFFLPFVLFRGGGLVLTICINGQVKKVNYRTGNNSHHFLLKNGEII